LNQKKKMTPVMVMVMMMMMAVVEMKRVSWLLLNGN
jgi:hypothetical protein